MASASFLSGPLQASDLTLAQQEMILLDHELRRLCRALFKQSGSLHRLREAALLGERDTPPGASWQEFAEYTDTFHGVAAEALALTLWHLGVEMGWSGRKCDRYRDAAEFGWNHRLAEECDDGNLSWHQGEQGDWEGNPATAPIVFRAIQEVYRLHAQRAPRATGVSTHSTSTS